MPLSDNLIHETSTSIGTGGFALNDVTGRQAFDEAFPTGTGGANVFWYAILNQDADEWEVGSGSHISGFMKRQTIIDSSNAGSRVTFSAGTKDVTSDIPWASRFYSGINNVPVGTDGVYPVTNKIGTLGKPANLWAGAYLASEGSGILFGLGATIRRPAGTNTTLTFPTIAPEAADSAALGTVALPWSDVFLATHGSDAAGIRWGASAITCATDGALNKTGSLRYTAANDGTPTNGATLTVSDKGGDVRTVVNGGSAWKIAPQTQNGVVVLFMENSATPGAVTATGGYDAVKGDAFTTATGDDFLLVSTVVNGRSVLVVHDATNDIV